MPKRGENIYKRKDGRWEGRYIRGRSPSGGAVYGYVYACSYRECRVKRQKQLEALGDAPEQAASLTLAQAAGRFLADREKQLKESTRARYAYLLRHYILPGLGETSVGQLTANGISDFLGGLQRGGLSGKSARDVGVLLKSVLKYSTRGWNAAARGWKRNCRFTGGSRSAYFPPTRFSVWRGGCCPRRTAPASPFCWR